MEIILIIAIALFFLVIIFARRVLIQEEIIFKLRKDVILLNKLNNDVSKEFNQLKDFVEIQDRIISDLEK